MFNDDFAGQGGSYVLDPATGKRTLVERTEAVGDAKPDENQPAPADQPAANQ